MPTSLTVDSLAQALDATTPLVAGVRADQWANRTPCADWDVRALTNHLVVGNRLFARMLRDDQPSPDELARLRATDALGSDPVGAFREAADAVVAAFREPGVLEKVVTIPAGTVPGFVALHIRVTEALVHGWDLARATGQVVSVPDGLAEQELEFSRAMLGQLGKDHRPFAPPRPAADDAPALDRLAACLGRDVAGTVPA